MTSFEAELDRLQRFLDASDAEDDLIAHLVGLPQVDRTALTSMLHPIQANSTVKRRQSYVSSIIVLYGALERYVEEAVAEYATQLVDIHKEFAKLPEALRERHTRLSIDYLASLKDGKIRETEDLSSIVTTLHDCLSGKTPLRLNARAFSLRSSNMKLSRIREIVGNLDIKLNGRRLLSTPSYSRFLAQTSDAPPKDMQDSEVESTLDHVDELVTLRNDIAHGVANLEAIENRNIVRDRAAKLNAFVSAMNEILNCELIKCRIVMDELKPVDGPVKVFGDNIACFAWPTGRIATGDILVMQPAENGSDLRHAPIESIQVDKADQEEVHGRDGLMIGVRVPFKVKFNGTFFVWASE
ncbi:MAE_28990/MAE_18760 family HEPN-like nuclease [Roseinatronobacter sp.]|uniref:MAE_28990/MAE_18760 family HEPN-like nuclease n=1 Tax=Roseinatronobacter sp. TaxID=1945755 RepID=UPI0025D607FB|nr:HEPN domain-containing protein [Roseibaca sp.]